MDEGEELSIKVDGFTSTDHVMSLSSDDPITFGRFEEMLEKLAQ